MTNYGEAAPVYIRRGWTTPLPLPAGRKYPPPEDSTGNFPEVDPGTIESWVEQMEDQNLGLRMPRVSIGGEPMEVIGIDIDQYEEKKGWDAIQSVFERIGALPPTYWSSSRGSDDPSGIRYFLVPAGQKWVGKVCDDVEVIQRTHRYSVGWPSVVHDKGSTRAYRWYDEEDEELDGPPLVQDLTRLPEEWIDFLLKGEAHERSRGEVAPELESIKGVRAWMQENFPGYAEQPSSEMASASQLDDLRDEASGGAHDMLVSRSHRVIMLAVEGHHGLQSALESIQTAFYDEVFGAVNEGSARRSADDARREVNRAIVQEIQKLQQDINDGYLAISPVGGFSAEDEEIDTATLREKTLEKWIERRSMIVDTDEFDDNDIGRGEMFLRALAGGIRPIIGGGWAWWNGGLGRLEEMEQKNLTKLWKHSVIASYKEKAGKLFDTADVLDEHADEEEAKKVRKKANDVARMARISGNASTINPALAIAHTMADDPIDRSEFDRDPLLIGVANGVVDFTAAKSGARVSAEDLLRPGTPEDMVFENTEVEYRPGARHPLWDSYLDTFLPDPEYRRFVRKVLGYSLIGGNPRRLMVFLQGKTSTGKSTMIRAVEVASGGYSTTVAANALFRERQDAGPAPEVLAAMPKRMIFSSEIGNHNRLHADVIKRLTGGDTLSARALYSNTMVTRTPMFTPLIATNSEPTIQDGDAALWRRLLVLPFDRQVPEETVPRDRIEDSPAALEAVLAWLIDGLADYLAEGLAPDTWPEICIKREKEFISGTSELQSFIAQHLRPDEGSRVDAQQLYETYQSWCAAERMDRRDVLTRTKFTRRLGENGIEARRTSMRVNGKKNPVAKMMYVGVALRRVTPEE
ncbi:DNA primase/polymerase/helicase [Rhodococcus phage MacGully]|nr:DNA primase/polymerase/helicase [Rhodococcus phage MacGully]